MSNLIAYIPALNQRHVDWFARHRWCNLFLIPQWMAAELVPRLSRNIVAVSTEETITMIQSLGVRYPGGLVYQVSDFAPDWPDPDLSSLKWKNWILPDEDVSRTLAEKYLVPAGCNVLFEGIWARYDMQAVQAAQPVIAGVSLSSDELDREVMRKLGIEAERSPDWWRRIAAMAVMLTGETVVACNTHLPTEYETYIFGDPRLNVDAGQLGKYCSIHAEEAVIALCARHGYKLAGGSVYVTTFPCEGCARQIDFAGVGRVLFREGYSSLNAQEVLRGIEIVQVV